MPSVHLALLSTPNTLGFGTDKARVRRIIRHDSKAIAICRHRECDIATPSTDTQEESTGITAIPSPSLPLYVLAYSNFSVTVDRDRDSTSSGILRRVLDSYLSTMMGFPPGGLSSQSSMGWHIRCPQLCTNYEYPQLPSFPFSLHGAAPPCTAKYAQIKQSNRGILSSKSAFAISPPQH